MMLYAASADMLDSLSGVAVLLYYIIVLYDCTILLYCVIALVVVLLCTSGVL